MARAKYIWVVRDNGSRSITGVWTVKHEMVTWLKRCSLSSNLIALDWEVIRFRDGKPHTCSIVPWSEIL
jgi:hypothetical protein